jgi:hypothetical protein
MKDNVKNNVEDNMGDNVEANRVVKLYSTVFSLTIKSKAFSILLTGLSHEMDLAF